MRSFYSPVGTPELVPTLWPLGNVCRAPLCGSLPSLKHLYQKTPWGQRLPSRLIVTGGWISNGISTFLVFISSTYNASVHACVHWVFAEASLQVSGAHSLWANLCSDLQAVVTVASWVAQLCCSTSVRLLARSGLCPGVTEGLLHRTLYPTATASCTPPCLLVYSGRKACLLPLTPSGQEVLRKLERSNVFSILSVIFTKQKMASFQHLCEWIKGMTCREVMYLLVNKETCGDYWNFQSFIKWSSKHASGQETKYFSWTGYHILFKMSLSHC